MKLSRATTNLIRLANQTRLPWMPRAPEFDRSPAWRKQAVWPAGTHAIHKPVTVQPVEADTLAHDRQMSIDAVEVVELHQARVYSSHRKLLISLADGREVRRIDIDRAAAQTITRQWHRPLPGTTVLLADVDGSDCYYHWMIEALPKLGALERYGVPTEAIDQVLMWRICTDFQRETLRLAGIGRGRIVTSYYHPRLHCERLLLVKIHSGMNMRLHPTLPAYTRNLCSTPGQRAFLGDANRRLYVYRPSGVRRGIVNETELLPILEARGFEIRAMEGLDVREQADLMSQVSILVSPHGAGLTNMIFCRPGTAIVELFGGHVFPFYYGLSQLMGHRYHALLERPGDYARLVSLEEAQRHNIEAVKRRTRKQDFRVDPVGFAALLDRVLDETRSARRCA